jgi:putative hemolysin
MTSMTGYALFLVALFCGSAFFSGSESAFFSIDRIALDKLAESPSRRKRTIPRLLADPGRLLATLLLGNELINITISAVGAQVIFELTGEAASEYWWLNILLITPLLLLFGEIGPKVIAIRNSIAWASAVSIPLRAFALIVTPPRLLLEVIARFVLKPVGDVSLHSEPQLREGQFKALVELADAQGALDSEEADMIHRVFDLSDTPVSKILTPRADIVSLGLNDSLDTLMETCLRARYSRLPVWSGDPDNVRGILVAKDLLDFRLGDKELNARTLLETLHPPYFVPPSKKAGELLREFQRERLHMAVVIDEYGAVLGIVTMHDTLEELFGTLAEDEDAPGSIAGVDRIQEGMYGVPSRFEVAEWNRRMRPPIPTGESWTTVGGYIFHLFGRLPKKGEEIKDLNWIFHVSGIEGTKMTRITITRRGTGTGRITTLAVRGRAVGAIGPEDGGEA